MADLSSMNDTDVAALRQDVLTVIENAVEFGYDVTIHEFSVQRSTVRKEAREFRDFISPNTSYPHDPKVKIIIELELPDGSVKDLAPLVERLTEFEKVEERTKLEARMAAAADKQRQAHDEYVAAKVKLNELNGVSPL